MEPLDLITYPSCVACVSGRPRGVRRICFCKVSSMSDVGCPISKIAIVVSHPLPFAICMMVGGVGSK